MTEIMLKRQAATIAAYYYRTAQLPCISEIAYFQPHDQVSHRLGLMDVDGNKKPAYDLWNYVDTNRTFKLADRYLPYLNMYYTDPNRYKTFYELMDLTDSGYWNRISETDFSSNIIRRIVEEDSPVIRLSGPNRYDTSIATAEELKEVLGVDSFKAIVLTTGRNFADALGGGYLAAKMQAPILITNPNSQKDIDKINDFLRRNLDPDGTLYILGGEGAVPQSCLKGLEDYKNVIRLAGKDRYKTNLLILEKAGVTDEDIPICTGKSFADSLAASATGKALLLVKGDGSLSAEQKAFLAAHSSNRFYIIGGTGAVNETIENEAKAYNSVQRLSGKTRYETSTLIAETFFHKPEKAILAYSHNFPDALGGGPLGYFTGSPIILTQTTKESTAQKYTYAQDIRKGYILGGDRWISSSCAALIFQLNADLD